MVARLKPVRVGMIGLGRAGWGMHSPCYEARPKKYQIVAACDPLKARQAEIAGRFGCRTYGKVADLIADPDVELIDVASRTPEHMPHTLAALAAGKMALVEKPMGLNYAEAKKLKAAAAKSKGRLFVYHNRRFEPGFQHVREIIASGLLGEVYEIKLRRNSYQRRDDWQTLIQSGGGQLLNWGPHLVDHGLRLLESPLKDLWSDLKRIAAVGDAEDHLKIIMRGENGRLIDIEISGAAALKEPQYVIFGSKGALVSDGKEIELRYLDPKVKLPRRKPKSSSPARGSGFGGADSLKWIEKTIAVRPKLKCTVQSIWDYLYDTLRKGAEFPISLDEALEVMRVISAVKKNTPYDDRNAGKG